MKRERVEERLLGRGRSFGVSLLCVLALFVILTACFESSDIEAPHRVSYPEKVIAFSAGETVLILAGRSSEEILFAGGIIWEHSPRVAAAVLTHRDTGGRAAGILNLQESWRLNQEIGLPDSNVFYFGYPTDGLLNLYNDYPNTGTVFAAPSGETSTYGNWGYVIDNSGTTPVYRYWPVPPFSFHRLWTAGAGQPRNVPEAPYNGEALTEDLAKLILQQRPGKIFTNSPFDGYADNRAAYLFLVRALKKVWESDTSIRPEVYTALVHGPARTDFGDYWTQGELDSGVNAPGGLSSYPRPDGAQPSGRMDYPYRFAELAVPEWRYRQVWQSDSLAWADIDRNPVYAAIDTSPAFTQNAQTLHWARGFVKLDAPFFYQNLGADVALRASAMASSSQALLLQTPDRAIDGVVDGLHDGGGDPRKEWAASGETVGAWIHLSWPSDSITVTGVTLYDRPNTRDQVTSGELFFDGVALGVPFGALPDEADTGLYVPINPPRVTSSLRARITGCKEGTMAAGFSEVMVFSPAP